MKRMIIVTIIFSIIAGLFAQQDNKGYISLEEFTNKVLPQAKSIKSLDDRKNLIFEQLERVFPRDKEKKSSDVKYLPELFKKIDNEADRQAILMLFDMGVSFKEKSDNLVDITIELLDDDYSSETRLASLLILKQIQSPKSIPALRKLIKTFPYTWEKIKYNMLGSNDYKLRLPMTAAVILGKMKDKESVPLLFEKLEKLGPKGYRALAEMGEISVPGLLERAREQIVEKKDGWAFGVLTYISPDDKESMSILRDAFRKETDAYYQSLLLRTIIYQNELNDRVFLKQLQKEYFNWDESTKTSILANSNILDDRDFNLFVIEKERDSQIISLAIQNIGKIGNKEDIPLVERYLSHENKSIRETAQDALNNINDIPILKTYDFQPK